MRYCNRRRSLSPAPRIATRFASLSGLGSPDRNWYQERLDACRCSITFPLVVRSFRSQALRAILTERASVSLEMARRLGKLCGNGPELWLALQTQYDLERLRREKAAEKAIPTLEAA
jgi:hypothetical protein